MTISPKVRSFLNQIFYSHNKFDNPDSIEVLKPWMLSNQNIELWKPKEIEDKIDIEKKIPDLKASPPITMTYPGNTQSQQNHSLFSPKSQDTLFWCIYVAYYGEAAYMAIGNKYKNEEIAEKQKIIEYIKSLKSSSFTNGIKISKVKLQEISAGLMIDKKTDWITFQVMCMFYKISAFVLNKSNNTYLHIKTADSGNKQFILYKSPNGRMSIDINEIDEEIQKQTKTIVETMVLIDHMSDRPLKAASAYKLEEIQLLASKLGITVDTLNILSNIKPKKTDWYNAVLSKMRE